MAETFFGPWRVVLELFDPHPQQRFVISGSDNADGLYVPEEFVPMDVAVSGTEWTIDLQLRWPPATSQWISLGARRTTRFVAPQGLTVRLEPSPGGYFTMATMRLLCISLDPDINPIPIPNPFDFTIPER